MAKLFEITAVRNNNILYDPVSTIYLNPHSVDSAVSAVYEDAAGATALGSQIIYDSYDKTNSNIIIATEAIGTINTRMNAANTTDVHRIPVTVIDDLAPATGYVAQFYKRVIGENVQDIWMVMTHPLNSANALFITENPTRDQRQSRRVEETAAAIAALANA